MGVLPPSPQFYIIIVNQILARVCLLMGPTIARVKTTMLMALKRLYDQWSLLTLHVTNLLFIYVHCSLMIYHVYPTLSSINCHVNSHSLLVFACKQS